DANDGRTNSAVINPYALAEVAVGRRIPWKQVPSARRVLEDILQTPYEELFDPKFGGPLYMGLRLNENLDIVPERSPLLDIEVAVGTNDLDSTVGMETIRTLGDLGSRFHTSDV